jgi:hypothetical protein
MLLKHQTLLTRVLDRTIAKVSRGSGVSPLLGASLLSSKGSSKGSRASLLLGASLLSSRGSSKGSSRGSSKDSSRGSSKDWS